MRELSFLLVMGFLSSASRASAYDFLIVPGKRVGPITATTSESELKEIFGKNFVKPEGVRTDGPEPLKGTAVFPASPEKKLVILWKDKKGRKRPSSVSIAGENSVWKTSEGVRRGTKLKELEKLNGGPFSVNCEGNDGYGAVIGWGGGKFKTQFGEVPGRKIFFRLNLPNLVDSDVPPESLIENSSAAFLQKSNPAVEEMIVEF